MTIISAAEYEEVGNVPELEQETASIMKFVLDRAGNPAPYYWKVPEDFVVPAIYFPVPEINTGGETFRTYNMDYSWYIRIFHMREEDAFSLGLSVVAAIRAARNMIPLIAEDGSEIEDRWVRVDDPMMKMLEDGTAQLTINWRSRRPYNDTVAGVQRSQSFNVGVFMKSGKEISDAYEEALERYAVPLNINGRKPE